jgi:hypothetical protein
MTLTTWGEWRRAHPETTVTKLDAAFAARWGYEYRPNAANRRRSGVSFPVWLQSAALPAREEILGLRVAGRTKAYPTARVIQARLVHDRLGEADLVLVGERESGSVRAYRRDGRTFQPGAATGELRDETGRVWRVTEESLLPSTEGASPLPRVPGVVAFWFGWYGFYPQTEVWGDSPAKAGASREH